jgi:hypothetical protein
VVLDDNGTGEASLVPDVRTTTDFIDRFSFARLWIARIGRKERARRVARVIVHNIFGAQRGGLGLPHLVCDEIADWVIQPTSATEEEDDDEEEEEGEEDEDEEEEEEEEEQEEQEEQEEED